MEVITLHFHNSHLSSIHFVSLLKGNLSIIYGEYLILRRQIRIVGYIVSTQSVGTITM